MALRVHPNGIGDTLGDSFVTASQLYTGAQVWFVSSEDGDDTYIGSERRQPFATLAQAIADASAGDFIVLLDGHTETLTSALAISKRLTIVGSGQSDGKPTVKFTNNSAAASLFTVSAAGVELRNIWIEENAQSNSAVKVNVTASLFRMVGCYVECNANDTDSALSLDASSATFEIKNTTFVSTATDPASPPGRAIIVVQGATRLVLDGVTFDGGTSGFEEGIAYSESSAVTQLIAEVTLLRGADMSMHASTLGYVAADTATVNGRIEWNGGGGA